MHGDRVLPILSKNGASEFTDISMLGEIMASQEDLPSMSKPDWSTVPSHKTDKNEDLAGSGQVMKLVYTGLKTGDEASQEHPSFFEMK